MTGIPGKGYCTMAVLLPRKAGGDRKKKISPKAVSLVKVDIGCRSG